MKKRFFTFTLLLLSLFVINTKTFSQPVPGGSAGDPGNNMGGDGTTDVDGGTAGTVGGGTELVIDLGSCGSFTIPSTSPYYNLLSSFLTTCHQTGGHVSTPCVHTSCCLQNLLTLYLTRCISLKAWGTCNSAPSHCNTVPRYCHH